MREAAGEQSAAPVQTAKGASLFAILPGVGACLGIALVAAWLGVHVPLVGGAVFAILLGILLGNVCGDAGHQAGDHLLQ